MKSAAPLSPKPPNYWKVLLMYILGAGLRYWLIFSKYQIIIGDHIEISTPLNSWKRVKEGLHLQALGINPYDGDLLHEAPLSLCVYKLLIGAELPVELTFIATDLLTSLLLFFVAKRYMEHLYRQQAVTIHEVPAEGQEFLFTGAEVANAPVFIVAAFLFNPYTVFNCVGLSTTVFHNLFLGVFLVALLYGSVVFTALSLSLCTLSSLYPGILIVPLYLNFATFFNSKARGALAVILHVGVLGVLLNLSVNLAGWTFVSSVYGFVLTVPDLQPNIGLFWYFFTEMFDHFRELFLCSFQINATVLYLVPLSIKFRKDPFLLTVALLFLIATFKSYPCLGDVGFAVSLLPCFIHLFSFTQQGFLVGVIFLITSALGPILWHLWIYSNSANANFYFGVTLAFAIAQIVLITDILFSYLKREFCLKHGKERSINGQEALLILE